MDERQTKEVLAEVAKEVSEAIRPRERGPRTRRGPVPRTCTTAEDRKERRERNRMAAERRKKRGKRQHGRPRGR